MLAFIPHHLHMTKCGSFRNNGRHRAYISRLSFVVYTIEFNVAYSFSSSKKQVRWLSFARFYRCIMRDTHLHVSSSTWLHTVREQICVKDNVFFACLSLKDHCLQTVSSFFFNLILLCFMSQHILLQFQLFKFVCVYGY